jgi:hypothetical protein
MLRLILIALLLITAAGASHGQSFVRATSAPVRVCPAVAGEMTPPDFTAQSCQTMGYWEMDPQGRALWFEARFTLTPDLPRRAGTQGDFYFRDRGQPLLPEWRIHRIKRRRRRWTRPKKFRAGWMR